eukprot:Nk52_evm27s2657 gene=Nk52_evmTU27s2657
MAIKGDSGKPLSGAVSAVDAAADLEKVAGIAKFEDMGLDQRILRALARLKWARPTLVQSKAIPCGLEGKDVLARARTGSGKTAAFVIPIIQRILEENKGMDGDYTRQSRSLILVPSKELCQQTVAVVKALTHYCSKEVTCLHLKPGVGLDAQKGVLDEKPSIIVSTPSRVVAHFNNKSIDLSSLQYMVVDEADLLFSFGYKADMTSLVSCLPKVLQSFLMSATLSPEVDELKELIMHNPVVLKLEESILPEEDKLAQFLIRCEKEDKYLLIYSLLKLKILKGKTILFVNSVDKCYHLKLFLEQFSIRACVLNSELPLNSRNHIVAEFNRGAYDYIIATDENDVLVDDEDDGAQLNQAEGKRKMSNNGGKKKSLLVGNKDIEYGVSRGVDFHNVANIVNFDVPETFKAYVHRVGRTARGENCGNALMLVSAHEDKHLENIQSRLVSGGLAKLKPFGFKMEIVEGFRYRVRDASRAVTKIAVKEARLKEIKQEVLNSEKLKAHFEDNPKDLEALRHDKTLHPSRIQSHLKHLPSYLAPKGASMKPKEGNSDKKRAIMQKKYREAAQKKKRKRTEDPLKSFSFKKKA